MKTLKLIVSVSSQSYKLCTAVLLYVKVPVISQRKKLLEEIERKEALSMIIILKVIVPYLLTDRTISPTHTFPEPSPSGTICLRKFRHFVNIYFKDIAINILSATVNCKLAIVFLSFVSLKSTYL